MGRYKHYDTNRHLNPVFKVSRPSKSASPIHPHIMNPTTLLRRQALQHLSKPSVTTLPKLIPRYRLLSAITTPTPLLTTRRYNSHNSTAKMSFSNADTGSKNPDPYTAKNLEEPSVKEKVEDLAAFIDKHKFCMMTTRIADSGLLASRCMAVAGKVSLRSSSTTSLCPTPKLSDLTHKRTPRPTSPHTNLPFLTHRKTTTQPSSSTRTPSPARPTTSTPTTT